MRWWFCVNASFHLYRVILYRAVISVIYSFMEAQGIQIKNEERNAVCKPHGLLGSSQSATNRLKLAFWDQRPSSVWSSWFLLLCPLFSLSHIPAKKKKKTQWRELFTQKDTCLGSCLRLIWHIWVSWYVHVMLWYGEMGRNHPLRCVCVCVSLEPVIWLQVTLI